MKSVTVCILLLLITTQSFAKGKTSSEVTLLSDVISAYSKNSNTAVIVAEDIAGSVNIFGRSIEDIDYDMFLAILKLKGLSAYKTKEYIAIIPDHQSRIHITETRDENAKISPDQYLTEIIQVKNMCASDLMPILKPLVHRHSYIEPVHSSNSIVVVDSQRNLVRIKSIVSNLDSNSEKEKKCKKVDRRPPVKKTS